MMYPPYLFMNVHVQNLPMQEESKSAVTQRANSSVHVVCADVWRGTDGLEEPLTFWASPTVVPQGPWPVSNYIYTSIYSD